MKKIFSIKKIALILICTIFTFIFSNYQEYKGEEIKEVNTTSEQKENITYKRISSEKAVFNYDVSEKKLEKILTLDKDNFYIDDKIAVTYDDIDNKGGIYIYDKANGEKKLILKSYVPVNNGKKIGDNIIFFAEGLYRKSNKRLCLYNVKTKQLEEREIENLKDCYVKDFQILDSNNFIYCKNFKYDKNSFYKVYSYNLKQNKEEELISENNHIISPVISHDKSKIAYIKKDALVYNLYVFDLATRSSSKISLEDGVVGGSIKWSFDSTKLICITANEGYNDVLNIVDLKSNKIEKVNAIYNAIFTAENNVIGASYNPQKSLQEIYEIDINTKEKYLKHSFYEVGSYSKSLTLENHELR